MLLGVGESEHWRRLSEPHHPRQLWIFRCVYQCQDVPQCWCTDINVIASMLGFYQCGEAGLSSSTRSEFPKLVHMASQYWYKDWWTSCLCWGILFWCSPSLLFKVYENVYLIPGSSIVTQKIRLIEIRLWNNNQHCIEWIIITHCIMSDVWSISIFLGPIGPLVVAL